MYDNSPEKTDTRLPLAYQKIYTRKIPSKKAEDKIFVYNHKYRHTNYLPLQAGKPISKIVY
jgi:hypothetical protein